MSESSYRLVDVGDRRVLTVEGREYSTRYSERVVRMLIERKGVHRAPLYFDFKETRSVSMWMKNTPLPLDMIFSDDRGRVLYIARNTVPYSEEIITPGIPVYAVLEVKAGTAHRLHISPGDRLIAAIFGAGG